MRVKFQADADLSLLIVKMLLRREPRVDFQTARAGGLTGLLDPAVLAFAAREQRVLVTHDQSTMPGHFVTSRVSLPVPASSLLRKS